MMTPLRVQASLTAKSLIKHLNLTSRYMEEGVISTHNPTVVYIVQVHPNDMQTVLDVFNYHLYPSQMKRIVVTSQSESNPEGYIFVKPNPNFKFTTP